MKIAVIHSYYSSRQPSGENIAVDAQVAALRSAEHEVLLLARRTDDLETRPFHAARSGLAVATGRGASPLGEIERFQPDFVHVHNLFPNWGTQWLKQLEAPLVATLHNFRAVCAAGTLYRAEAPCEECPAIGRRAAVRHGCYRGSPIATLPVAMASRRDASRYPVIARADRVVALSQRSADTFIRLGLDASKIDIVPNFVAAAPHNGRASAPNGRWIYVGRLSPEKGILELLRQWPVNRPLDIVGDGPLAPDVARVARGLIQFLGPMAHGEVLQMLPDYAGLAFPSVWQEGAAPLVVLEALASGLPVVAAPGNSAADVVAETGAGLVVGPDLPWESAITEVSEQARYGAAAKAAFEGHFSQGAWLREVARVYQSVIGGDAS